MLAIRQVTTNQSDRIYSSHPILFQETGLMKDNNLIHTETGPIHHASETTPLYFSCPTTQVSHGNLLDLLEHLFVLYLPVNLQSPSLSHLTEHRIRTAFAKH